MLKSRFPIVRASTEPACTTIIRIYRSKFISNTKIICFNDVYARTRVHGNNDHPRGPRRKKTPMLLPLSLEANYVANTFSICHGQVVRQKSG